MPGEDELLPVDCERLPDLLPDGETVKALNRIITEPETLVEEEVSQPDDLSLHIDGMPDNALPEMEISREEDYFRVREEGQLETLLEQVMARECRENNNGLWLTATLMGRLAKNQIFGEGNKRTSYLVGALFLRNLQADQGFEGAVIPQLNRGLTRMLSDVAIQAEEVEVDEDELHSSRDVDRDIEDLYSYLADGLREYIEEREP